MIVNATYERDASTARLCLMHDLATLRHLNHLADRQCVHCGEYANTASPLATYEAFTANRLGEPVLVCADCAMELADCGRPLHRVRP